VQFDFTVPPALLAQTSGVVAGTAGIRVEISDVGAEVQVEPPEGGGFQPLSQLIERLTDLAALGL
jgi:hypothetical protein